MTIESAIKKAIEGEYNVGPIEVDMLCDNKYAHYFLDPLFQQSLGKAMGWKEKDAKTDCPTCGFDGGRNAGYGWGEPEWNFYWHKLINHLAEGKTADSFFQSL